MKFFFVISIFFCAKTKKQITMGQMNFMTEFSIRNDSSFNWEEFHVVVERCDLNISKLALYAVEGDVQNQMGNIYHASESHPYQVLIKYDRIGDLLSAFQRKYSHEVKGFHFFKLNFIYVFSEPRHGGQFPNK